jgi:hypothetical protein
MRARVGAVIGRRMYVGPASGSAVLYGFSYANATNECAGVLAGSHGGRIHARFD